MDIARIAGCAYPTSYKKLKVIFSVLPIKFCYILQPALRHLTPTPKLLEGNCTPVAPARVES